MKNEWMDKFKSDSQVILSTVDSDNKPHSIIAISIGFYDDKLLIADCYMDQTIRNLELNNNICVVGGYFRVKGTADIFKDGKYFDICKDKNKDSGFVVKSAILITINEVTNLDTQEKIL